MQRLKTRMPGILLGALLVLTGVGCQDQDTPEAGAPEDEAAGTAGAGALSEAERAEGWEALFDGEDLEGWRGYGQDSLPQGWMVEDGAIYFNGDSHGDLMTEATFDDFELALDWKISEGGNSGIMFRVSEDHERPYETGPEMQVLDNARHPDASNGPDRYAGANYALHAPSDSVVRPAGEWNEVRLVVDSAHVEHWLNGTKVVEYELWSDDWKQRVKASKFDAMPGYGLNRTGHIVLQDHGDPVWFRNIRIRRL